MMEEIGMEELRRPPSAEVAEEAKEDDRISYSTSSCSGSDSPGRKLATTASDSSDTESWTILDEEEPATVMEAGKGDLQEEADQGCATKEKEAPQEEGDTACQRTGNVRTFSLKYTYEYMFLDISVYLFTYSPPLPEEVTSPSSSQQPDSGVHSNSRESDSDIETIDRGSDQVGVLSMRKLLASLSGFPYKTPGRPIDFNGSDIWVLV